MKAGDLDDDRIVYRYPGGSNNVHLERGCCSDIADSACREMRARIVNPEAHVCSHCGPREPGPYHARQSSGHDLRKALHDADPEEPDPERLRRPSTEAARGDR